MSSEKKQESHFIFLNITVAIWATVMFVLFPAQEEATVDPW